MSYLPDTNVWVCMLRNTSTRVSDRIRSAPPGEILLCSITLAELWYGAVHSRKQAENLRALDRLRAEFSSIPFDDDCAATYAQIRSSLARAGTPIGPNDLMIAAIAMANGLTVVTRNVREFQRVAGLRVENWESP